MIFEVELHAFGRGEIREVDVPDHALTALPPLSNTGADALSERKNAILDLIFKYGQNDFQRKPQPSVSVGDVVRMDQARWAVMPFGFKLVAPDFTPPHDGGIWAYKERSL